MSITNSHKLLCIFTFSLICCLACLSSHISCWLYAHSMCFEYKRFVLTYLWRISFLSWRSSNTLTDRSAMETAVEAVSVTSSTSVPSPSSRGRSSLCVHSFERTERSTWHLTHTQHHHHYHVVLQDTTCMTKERNNRKEKKNPKQNAQ